MTTLRKKIFHSKIQNIVSQNKFVLFFQFNNVKFTDWIFLKNQILQARFPRCFATQRNNGNFPFNNEVNKVNEINKFLVSNAGLLNYNIASLPIKSVSTFAEKSSPLPVCVAKQRGNVKSQKVNHKNITAIVIKNKISHKTFLNNKTKISKYREYPSPKNLGNQWCENYLQQSLAANSTSNFNQEKLNFLCQGPTLLIYFNSINQCKVVYDILNQYTSNFSYTESVFKPEFSDSHNYKKSCLNTSNLPLLFSQKKSNLYLQKHNSIKKKNMKSTFFFMGGFFKGKIINHLDLEKLLQLDSRIYADLITQCYNPVLKMFFFNVIVKIKFLKCFQNNLLSLLNIYKHNLKKIPV